MASSNIEINCIAVIGKQNNPLYIKNFGNIHPDLKYHYIVHTSIDVIEERVNSPTKMVDAYLGLLYTMEDLAVYGYYTNTRIKFVVVITVPEGIIRDMDMKTIFRNIHTAYIAQTSNPFYAVDLQKPIVSKRFMNAIEAVWKEAGGGGGSGVGGENTNSST